MTPGDKYMAEKALMLALALAVMGVYAMLRKWGVI